jgi:Zn-finger nucleic acid-binding protein
MKCPVCKSSYLHSLETEELPQRLVCDDCGGIWIKAFQYWKWLEAHGANLPERPSEESTKLPVADSTKAKLCPECGHILTRRMVGHGIDFQIDRCGTCGGIWFDKNEWEILKSRNLHDDIHFIFSSAWQHRIIEEQQKKTYEKRIETILGNPDIVKLKDMKLWIAGHPKRTTMMAFLSDLET